MTLRVGLTGGIAGGKSTVARLLTERGATVVDADRLVAALYEPGEPGARAVAGLFGEELLDERGAVDRARLAERIFADESQPGELENSDRARLERAIHPLVRQRFARLAAETEGIVVLEATLLVEAGYGPDFDLVVSVEAAPATRLARAVHRGMDEQEARRRLAAQGDGATRRAGTDVILENDGTLDELEQAVDRLVERLRALERDATGRGERPGGPQPS